MSSGYSVTLSATIGGTTSVIQTFASVTSPPAHTIQVTGAAAGVYWCKVTYNTVDSQDSAQVTISGKSIFILYTIAKIRKQEIELCSKF